MKCSIALGLPFRQGPLPDAALPAAALSADVAAFPDARASDMRDFSTLDTSETYGIQSGAGELVCQFKLVVLFEGTDGTVSIFELTKLPRLQQEPISYVNQH